MDAKRAFKAEAIDSFPNRPETKSSDRVRASSRESRRLSDSSSALVSDASASEIGGAARFSRGGSDASPTTWLSGRFGKLSIASALIGALRVHELPPPVDAKSGLDRGEPKSRVRLSGVFSNGPRH